MIAKFVNKDSFSKNYSQIQQFILIFTVLKTYLTQVICPFLRNM